MGYESDKNVLITCKGLNDTFCYSIEMKSKLAYTNNLTHIKIL